MNPDYTEVTRDGGCNLYLLGWTGDFNDGYNFLGTWFAKYQKEWGFQNEELFDLLERASTEPDVEARVALYEEANEFVMDFLPACRSPPRRRPSPSPPMSTRPPSPR